MSNATALKAAADFAEFALKMKQSGALSAQSQGRLDEMVSETQGRIEKIHAAAVMDAAVRLAFGSRLR